MRYEVIARDPELTRLGLVDYLTLTVVAKFNAISTWTLTVDANSSSGDLLGSDTGVVIRSRDDKTGATRNILSGVVSGETIAEEVGRSTRTVTGVDDTDLLWSDFIYPDPTQPAAAQLAGTGDVRTGILETLLLQLVDLNIGPSALPARQVPHLAVDIDGLRGPSVTSSVVEFASLGDQLVTLALNGGLGFRVLHDDSTGLPRLLFSVYQPTDRSLDAVFSFNRKNLTKYELSTQRPGATRTIVAGGDDGALRFFLERTNTEALQAETDWGGRRRVAFVDKRDSVDEDTLNQAGDEYLAANGTGVGINLSPIDTPDLTYGRDYFLGDKVTVNTSRGPISDVVRQVTITAAGGQPPTTVPLVGTPDGPQPGVPDLLRLNRKVLAELGVLKRRV